MNLRVLSGAPQTHAHLEILVPFEIVGGWTKRVLGGFEPPSLLYEPVCYPVHHRPTRLAEICLLPEWGMGIQEKVLGGFKPPSLDSESRVLTVTP